MKKQKKLYMGELPNKPVCIDKRLFLPLKGEDELLYVAVFDINGNIIGTPIQGAHYDYSEGRLIVDSNTKLAVYNENGEPIFSLSDLGYTAVTPYKDGVARAMYEKESDEDERSAMSRILGSRIIDGSQVSLHGDDMIGQKGWYYIDLEGKRLFERVEISEAIELEK